MRANQEKHYIQRLYTADVKAIDLIYAFSEHECLGSLPSRDETDHRTVYFQG